MVRELNGHVGVKAVADEAGAARQRTLLSCDGLLVSEPVHRAVRPPPEVEEDSAPAPFCRQAPPHGLWVDPERIESVVAWEAATSHLMATSPEAGQLSIRVPGATGRGRHLGHTAAFEAWIARTGRDPQQEGHPCLPGGLGPQSLPRRWAGPTRSRSACAAGSPSPSTACARGCG